MMNDAPRSPAAATDGDLARASLIRSLEGRRTDFVMPDRPARRLPPRSRRHSVRHRSIR